MALSLKNLAELASARHGIPAAPLEEDLRTLMRVVAEHPDLFRILAHLVEHRRLLEQENSRLGCKVTRLETALADAEQRLTAFRNNR